MAGPFYVDPAAAGSNNGTDWTNAWTSIQSAFDTATAGEIVYCRGTQTVAAKIDIDTNSGGNTTGFIKFIGCNASGNVDGTRFVIQGDGANACDLLYKTGAMHMIWLENIELKSAYSTGNGLNTDTTNGTGWVFINCSFNNNAADGVATARYITYSVFIRCCFYSNGSDGLNASGAGNATFIFCSFHDNTAYGIAHTNVLTSIGCVSHGNDDGISAAPGCLIYNNVIDGNADDGIVVAGSAYNYSAIILGSRITNQSGAGDIGLNCNGEPTLFGWNYFKDNNDNIYDESSVLSQFIPGQGGSTTTNNEDTDDADEGYADQGNHDFNLNSDAETRRVAITVPWT